MLPVYLALVSETDQVSHSEIARVGAALQKQAVRDFGPIWNVSAMVHAFVQLDDVPLGYWPIIIEEDIDVPGAAGIHLDSDGQPFALVQYSPTWSLTASHELLEMLADPFGNRLVAGESLKAGQGRVEYLVEVCDPSEAASFSYKVNGVMVSDFYSPHYFDPVKSEGVQYSYTGAITSPRQVLKGGYLSWHDTVTNHWWQLNYLGSKRKYRDLGILGKLSQSLRATIDKLTPNPQLLGGLDARSVLVAAARETQEAAEKSANSKAASWRAQIQVLKTGA